MGCALQKNVAAVHVNSMPKFDETDPVSVSAAAGGGQINCAVDPEVQALVAFQCGDLNVDESLPFEVSIGQCDKGGPCSKSNFLLDYCNTQSEY